MTPEEKANQITDELKEAFSPLFGEQLHFGTMVEMELMAFDVLKKHFPPPPIHVETVMDPETQMVHVTVEFKTPFPCSLEGDHGF